MNGSTQSPVSQGMPPLGRVISETVVSAPSDFFPPTPPTPEKKFGGGKLIATFLGVLLLVGGLATGVVLVSQPQLLEQKAAPIVPKLCSDVSLNLDLDTCTKDRLNHSTYCMKPQGPGINYESPFRQCCRKGYRVSNNDCVM